MKYKLNLILGLLIIMLSMSAVYSDLNQDVYNYYKFDVSEDPQTDSVNNDTLALSNNPSFVTGKIGNAYDYNGINQSMVNTLNDFGNVYTINFWVNLDAVNAEQELLTAEVQNWWGIKIKDSAQGGVNGRLTWRVSPGAGYSYLNHDGLNASEWYMITAVSDGSNAYLYFNGELADSASVSSIGMNYGLRVGSNRLATSQFTDGTIDETGIWTTNLSLTDIQMLYNSGSGLQYPFSMSNLVMITSPNDDNTTTLTYDQTNLYLNATTLNPSTCTYDFDSTNASMSTTGGTSHSQLLSFPQNFNESVIYPINIRCDDTSTIVSKDVTFTHQAQPYNLTLNNPNVNQVYTFDVESFWLNVSTSYNDSSCNVFDQTSTTNLSANGNSHSLYYNMGSSNNETKAFTFNVSCSSPSSVNVLTQDLFVNQSSVPLNLTIFVPQDAQLFDYDTELLTYFIETNYVASCEYTTLNNTANFTNTGNIAHTTNYTTFFPEIRNYPTSFTCNGIIVNESITLNVTYILDEIPTVNNVNTVLTDTTGQLGAVGEDVGGFVGGISPGVVGFIFGLAIIFAIVNIFIALITFMKSVRGKK